MAIKFFFNGTPFDIQSKEILIGRKDNQNIYVKSEKGEFLIPTNIAPYVSSKHLIIKYNYQKKSWVIIDQNSTNGTYVSFDRSNWMNLTSFKEFFYTTDLRISLCHPSYNFYIGFTDENIFTSFKNLFEKTKNSETKIKTISLLLTKLKNIGFQIDKEKWESFWWWTKSEEREIKDLSKLLDELNNFKEVKTDLQYASLSIALKKIIYAHAHNDYEIIEKGVSSSFTPKTILDAIHHIDMLLDNKLHYAQYPINREIIHKTPLYDVDYLKQEIINSIDFALKNVYSYEKITNNIEEDEIYSTYSKYIHPPDEKYSQEKYDDAIAFINKKLDDEKELELDELSSKDGDWYYIYRSKYSKANEKYRYYFNFNMNKIDEFFKIFIEEFLQSNSFVHESLYFKFSQMIYHTVNRKDRLVLYSSIKLHDQIRKCFYSKPELFNEEKLPFTTRVCKGISFAPELRTINIDQGNSEFTIYFYNNDLSLLSSWGILINGIDSKNVNYLNDNDIIYFKASNLFYKIKIDFYTKKFCFSIDGKTFSNIWFPKLRASNNFREVDDKNYFRAHMSFGQDFNNYIHKIWSENKNLSKEQIADKVIVYFKHNFVNGDFSKL
jgi:hypothetical protein